MQKVVLASGGGGLMVLVPVPWTSTCRIGVHLIKAGINAQREEWLLMEATRNAKRTCAGTLVQTFCRCCAVCVHVQP